MVNYLGHELASTLVKEYDVHLLLPLLVWCYKVMIPFSWEVEVQVQDD